MAENKNSAENLAQLGFELGAFSLDKLGKIAQPEQLEIKKIEAFGMGIILALFQRYYPDVPPDQFESIQIYLLRTAFRNYYPGLDETEAEEFEEFSLEIMQFSESVKVFLGGEPGERRDRVYTSSMLILNQVCPSSANWMMETINPSNEKPGFFSNLFKKKAPVEPPKILVGMQLIGDCIFKGDELIRETFN